MKRTEKNTYHFRKPPQLLRKVTLDTIAIVPASMLPFTEILREHMSKLPHGGVFLCFVKENARQRKVLEQVEAVFTQHGHAVTKRSYEQGVFL
jgi:hypothetical protein